MLKKEPFASYCYTPQYFVPRQDWFLHTYYNEPITTKLNLLLFVVAFDDDDGDDDDDNDANALAVVVVIVVSAGTFVGVVNVAVVIVAAVTGSVA